MEFPFDATISTAMAVSTALVLCSDGSTIEIPLQPRSQRPRKIRPLYNQHLLLHVSIAKIPESMQWHSHPHHLGVLLDESSLESCNNYTLLRRQSETSDKAEKHTGMPTCTIVTSPRVSGNVPFDIYKSLALL